MDSVALLTSSLYVCGSIKCTNQLTNYLGLRPNAEEINRYALKIDDQRTSVYCIPLQTCTRMCHIMLTVSVCTQLFVVEYKLQVFFQTDI